MVKLLKTFAFIFFITSLLNCGNVDESKLPILQNKLEGTWQLENANTFEIWKSQDSVLIGKVIKIENRDTLLLENLRILEIRNKIFYEAAVISQNNGLPIQFRLIQSNNNEFVFINKKHDFPKKIIYNFQNENLLAATVSGNDKSISFKYVKIK